MAGALKDYLPYGRADYGATVLAIRPRELFIEDGEKNVTLNEGDDGSVESISHAERPWFYVEFDPRWLPKADADLLWELYFNPVKANGTARSFYWRHPEDGAVYVARFTGKLSRQFRGSFRNFQPVRLRIEARANAPVQRAAI